MTAEIIDGKGIAARLREGVGERAKDFAARFGRPPRLEVVLVGEDPGSQVYVRNKERAARGAHIDSHVHRMPSDTSQQTVVDLVRRLNDHDGVDGILVQLPLPPQIEPEVVLDEIDPLRDVDGLHPHNVGRLALGREGLKPCTSTAVMKLLDEIDITVQGKHAVMVGHSNLVGKPTALLLLERMATVSIAHKHTEDVPGLVNDGDIVVVAVGRPRLIQGSWLKPGAVVLDVGINRLDDGKLVGDVDYESAVEQAGWITPVPGGIGPMTIAMLLANTVYAAEWRASVR